jgi:CubicO group peptidase (beta-lactamase class C family)
MRPLAKTRYARRLEANMSNLDRLLRSAIARGDVPYAVAMVGNHAGPVWGAASGEATAGCPVSVDTTFRLWSMTKAIGSLAAMILIDRGSLSLETPVEEIIPSFGELKVIESISAEGELVLRPALRRATLRHLLTHTAGTAYPLFNEKMLRYMQVTGQSYVSTGAIDELMAPLVFDPGEGWAYGIGVEWTGYMVQEVTGIPIDQFCTVEIFEPLGMTSTVFEPEDAASRPAQVYGRAADGSFTPIEFAPPPHPEIYGMGGAVYSTAPDYLRLLQLVLAGGAVDGRRIVSVDSLELMMQSQMAGATVPRIKSLDYGISADVDLVFADTPVTHTAGFLRTERDIPGMRCAGSLWWAGFLNTHFWVDPTRDVAAVFMTQTLPFCDPRCMDVLADFERAVYADLV